MAEFAQHRYDPNQHCIASDALFARQHPAEYETAWVFPEWLDLSDYGNNKEHHFPS